MNNFIPLPALASGTYVYVKRKMVALTADEIDCIIAYIVPLNLWYVLPVESFSPCKNLWFYPNGSKKGSRFESSREAWWLLSPELKEASGEQPPEISAKSPGAGCPTLRGFRRVGILIGQRN